MNTVVGNGPVASHVSDVAPAVSCAIENVDAVEIVAPENVNDAVVTAGITNTFCAPRNELLITDTDKIEIPVAIDTLAVVPSVGTEIDVLEPSEIDTVETAAAALMNSLVVVTVSPLPTSEKAPLCAAVIDTVVCPIVVDDVPISVTDPPPPAYRKFTPPVLNVVLPKIDMVSEAAALIVPMLTLSVVPLTVPQESIEIVLAPDQAPVAKIERAVLVRADDVQPIVAAVTAPAMLRCAPDAPVFNVELATTFIVSVATDEPKAKFPKPEAPAFVTVAALTEIVAVVVAGRTTKLSFAAVTKELP